MNDNLNPRTDPTPQLLQRQARWHPPEGSVPGAVEPYLQGALALTFPLASGIEAEPTSSALTVVAESPDQCGGAPDPRVWASRFLQAVVEVVSSDRPLAQLARWTDPQVFAEIAQRRQWLAAHRSPSHMRTGRQHVATVHISRPGPRTAEVAARVTTGPRSRAVAARLDYRRDRWLCTALDFG